MKDGGVVDKIKHFSDDNEPIFRLLGAVGKTFVILTVAWGAFTAFTALTDGVAENARATAATTRVLKAITERLLQHDLAIVRLATMHDYYHPRPAPASAKVEAGP